jgi:PAS domain S-box-containing protein
VSKNSESCENAPSIIFTLSLAGIFTFVSHSWRKLLGHATNEVIGRHFSEFVQPLDQKKCRRLFEKAVNEGRQLKKVRYSAKHKDGTWHWHDSSGSLIEGQDRNNRYYIGVSNDITEMIEMNKNF